MTVDELEELFRKHDDEYGKDDRVDKNFSLRPDLHAFILLDKICEGRNDLICHAGHDEIFLDVELSDLAKRASEDQIVELIRCGVRISEDALAMFV